MKKLSNVYEEILNENSIFTENDGDENCDCCRYFDFTHSQAGASYGGLTHPIYYEIEKGIRHELKYVSPEKYMREIAKGFGMSYEESLKSHAIRWHSVKEYAQSMLNGEKFPIGFYQSSGSQEGRHRALAAMELGCNMIPVILFTKVSRDEAILMVKRYKGLDRETVNQIYVDKGYKGISDLDWRELQNFIKYRLPPEDDSETENEVFKLIKNSPHYSSLKEFTYENNLNTINDLKISIYSIKEKLEKVRSNREWDYYNEIIEQIESLV